MAVAVTSRRHRCLNNVCTLCNCCSLAAYPDLFHFRARKTLSCLADLAPYRAEALQLLSLVARALERRVARTMYRIAAASPCIGRPASAIALPLLKRQGASIELYLFPLFIVRAFY